MPLWLTLLIFAAAAAAAWVAGISLFNETDVLSARLHLGAVLGGIVLLAVATNLPEIALAVSAAISGNTGVVVGNILGGIAIQTVALVALDAFGVKDHRPRMHRAPSVGLVLNGGPVVEGLARGHGPTQLPSWPTA